MKKKTCCKRKKNIQTAKNKRRVKKTRKYGGTFLPWPSFRTKYRIKPHVSTTLRIVEPSSKKNKMPKKKRTATYINYFTPEKQNLSQNQSQAQALEDNVSEEESIPNDNIQLNKEEIWKKVSEQMPNIGKQRVGYHKYMNYNKDKRSLAESLLYDTIEDQMKKEAIEKREKENDRMQEQENKPKNEKSLKKLTIEEMYSRMVKNHNDKNPDRQLKIVHNARTNDNDNAVYPFESSKKSDDISYDNDNDNDNTSDEMKEDPFLDYTFKEKPQPKEKKRFFSFFNKPKIFSSR
jgi:hypothetical protein